MGRAPRPVEMCLRNATVVSARFGLHCTHLPLIEPFYMVNALNDS